MKWMTVSLLVGVSDEEAASWGSGCDQTFGAAWPLHNPEKNHYVLRHTRGLLDLTDAEVEELKVNTFTKEGGI